MIVLTKSSTSSLYPEDIQEKIDNWLYALAVAEHTKHTTEAKTIKELMNLAGIGIDEERKERIYKERKKTGKTTTKTKKEVNEP